VCFFSQKKIIIPQEMRYEDNDTLMKYLTCHHLNQERENERLFDEEMMVPVLDKYHMEYHNSSVANLLKTSWYIGFLERLKLKNYDVYKKELYKQVKAGIINLEEYERKTI